MLSKLSESTDKWDRELQRIEFTINNTLCRSTGETPCMLSGVQISFRRLKKVGATSNFWLKLTENDSHCCKVVHLSTT